MMITTGRWPLYRIWTFSYPFRFVLFVSSLFDDNQLMMAQVVAIEPALSDSTFKTRPNFKAFIQTDQNAGLDSVEMIEATRRARQMKFPSLTGQKTARSLNEPLSNQGYVKYNDEGDHRVNAPYRFYSNMIDPVSGFISAAGDVNRNTGVTKVWVLLFYTHIHSHMCIMVLSEWHHLPCCSWRISYMCLTYLKIIRRRI